MGVTQQQGLAPTLQLTSWYGNVGGGGLLLALGRAGTTWQPVTPTLGAEQLEFLISNDQGIGNVDATFLFRFGYDASNSPAAMWPFCNIVGGTVAANVQPATVYEVEFTVPAALKGRITIPTSHKYFTVGCYLPGGAVPSGMQIDLRVDRRVSVSTNPAAF